jgi:hypothetical protein
MADPSHAHDPFDPHHLFGHVQDAPHFEVPHMVSEGGKVKLWQLSDSFEPFVDIQLMKADPNWHLAPFDLSLTKFMVLEVIAAVFLIAFFIPLARKMSDGSPVKGKWANMLEAMKWPDPQLEKRMQIVFCPSCGPCFSSSLAAIYWAWLRGPVRQLEHLRRPLRWQ